MNFKINFSIFLTFALTSLLFLTAIPSGYAQESSNLQQKSNFWKDVHFGGGLGLGIGSGYTNIMVAPSAIYNVNEYFSTGLGAQYSYVNSRDYFNSHLYGVSLIELFNPIPETQISVELEQLRVNNTYTQFNPEIKDNFWNTALFLGRVTVQKM